MDICFLVTPVLKFNPALDDPSFGSDVVLIDLEDSIHFSAKVDARKALAKLDLRGLVEKGHRFGIRVNSLMSIDGIRDLDVVHAGYEAGSLAIDYLHIPKVSSHHELLLCKSLIGSLSPRLKLFPLIETPEGVANVEKIAAHSDAMLFGQADITSSMYHPNASYLGYARGRFCIACARHGIPAIDTKGFENVTDMVGFEKACSDAKDEGFTGKSVIHPKQVPIVKNVFSVSPEEIEKYRLIISRYHENDTGFTIIDGQVIAPPFVAKAKKMLALWGDSLRERR